MNAVFCVTSRSFRESETEFRRYWLLTKFAEMKSKGAATDKIEPLNAFKFKMLAHFACDADSIRAAATRPPGSFDEQVRHASTSLHTRDSTAATL